MIDTDKHEEKLKDYEYRKNELLIYTDRSEEHPLGAYKFRQKDWQVRRFINDAVRAGWTLSSMKEIYDEAMEEVKRLREEVKMLWHYADTEQMYNDGLLTVEGEMKND
jgi:hypothetical protein